MQQVNQFFAAARPLRLFITVALPGMISMLAASVYSLIEGVFIGHLIGGAAFAAVNIAMPFVMINFSLADLVGVGSSAPISIALGRKDHQRANNIFTCSILLILATAALMGLILFFASPPLVRLMGAEGHLAQLAVRYVRTYALLGPVTTLVFAMDNYMRISGFVKSSMLLNIFMSCLTALLLFLLLGPAGMNVEGSALAACISMSVCAIIALVPFVLKKSVLRFVRPRFSWAMLKNIVACGTPVFLNNVAGRVASIVMNTALLRMGGEIAVSAYAVLMYAGGIIEPLLYGMCDSAAPAIGYNWGARSLPRVRGIAKCSFCACGITSVLGAAAMFFFASPLTALFVNGQAEPRLFDMSVAALRLFSTTYLFRWFAFAVQSFYSAIGKPLPASVISVCNAMVFPILFVFALWPLQLNGLWLNMSATALVVTLISLFMLLRSQKHLSKDIDYTP